LCFSWRQEQSAKSVLNELSAAKTINMVKLYGYKNGEGRLKQGELIVGSSIQGLLGKFYFTKIFFSRFCFFALFPKVVNQS
jgi:hypothetical protein